MPPEVRLIAHTTEPSRVVAAAGRLCYSPVRATELYDGLDPARIAEFLGRLRDAGHLSPFEHASFTFAIEGISRVATHQLVRHRVASFSQQSQRYVTMGEVRCVVPPEVADIPEAAEIFADGARRAHEAYEKLISLGVSREDARFILPHGWETSLAVTMNARELHHFFGLRLCRRAQWEIRDAARRMLALAREAAPELFETAGPACVTDRCREKNSCGRPYSGVEEVLSDERNT
jgi:thymidylate synthase (FAD)